MTPKKLKKEAKRLHRDCKKALKYRHNRLTPTALKNLKACCETLEAQLQNPSELPSAFNALHSEMQRHAKVLRKPSPRENIQSFGVAILLALFIRAFFLEAFKIPTGSMIPSLQVGDHLFVNKLSHGPRIPFTNIRIAEFRKPVRGEIVVFVFPGKGEDEGKDFIKRIVAIEGDEVQIIDNVLYVNNEPTLIAPPSPPRSCEDQTLPACRCIRQREKLGDVEFESQHVIPTTNIYSGCFNIPLWPSYDPRQLGGPQDNPAFPRVVVPRDHVFTIGDNRDNSSDGRFWGFVPVDYIKGRALFFWWPPSRMFKAVHQKPPQAS